jgi:cytochrome aa3 quinol oxidase subunit IV
MAEEASQEIIWDEERGEPGFGFLQPHFQEEKFPTPQVIGYLLSLVFTFASFLLVIDKVLPGSALLVTILALAVCQAGLQLGIFMHLKESRGPAWQIIPLFLGFVIAGGLIGMSIWIMMFKWGGY